MTKRRTLRERPEPAREPAAPPPSPGGWRGFLLGQLVGTVFGPFIRLISAVVLSAGGLFLIFAWQAGPQKALDAAHYERYTQRVTGKIIESWLAVEVNLPEIRQPKNWRASSRATPCEVVEYEGDWGPATRRAYCGGRLQFSDSYTLYDLSELTEHVPFAWARDEQGFSVPEIRIGAGVREWLAAQPIDTFMHRSWPARSALEELRIELDQPIDYAIAGWMA
jgi:hypothetical protein